MIPPIVAFLLSLALILGIGLHSTSYSHSTTHSISDADAHPHTHTNDGGGGSFLVGTGIHDITGPIVQVNFMGYAAPSQVGRGLHTRLRSRCYIIASPTVPTSRIAFVSIDGGMGSDILNIKVLPRVAELLNDSSLYTIENLAISGTHSHSGPAGFMQYVLYQFTSLGYVKETQDSIVEGIAQSIFKAHTNLVLGEVYVNTDNALLDANINRSPYAYLFNPANERKIYEHVGDTDKNMFLMKLVDGEGKGLGMINWFAVHGTSMNNTNLLVSGDNKGYASQLFENKINPESLPGNGKFVAAFASTNLGDVSPNTAGPRCIDTGLPCDFATSTCGGRNELCIAFGPGKNGDMFESTKIIGKRQFDHAVKLYDEANVKLSGAVDYRHSFLNMKNRPVHLPTGQTVHTCTASLGYAFAAGTTDGPGMFDFTQGTNTSNKFWNTVSGFISKPSAEEVECQKPKPILLNTGDVNFPYAWDPKTVPISIFRIGATFILNAPGELTTMAGRRLRSSLTTLLQDTYNLSDVTVTIAGLTNTYTHYITTREEYHVQRYEGASTLYGQHTLQCYINEFMRIASDLMEGRGSETDGSPMDLSEVQLEFVPAVGYDVVGDGERFGDCVGDVDTTKAYTVHSNENNIVTVTFVGSNPRNNQRLQGSYLTVEKRNDNDDKYTVKFTDSSWSTQFHWIGGVGHQGESKVRIEWRLSELDYDKGKGGLEDLEGIYRICYFGTSKRKQGGGEGVGEVLEEFQGCSSDFKVSM